MQTRRSVLTICTDKYTCFCIFLQQQDEEIRRNAGADIENTTTTVTTHPRYRFTGRQAFPCPDSGCQFTDLLREHLQLTPRFSYLLKIHYYNIKLKGRCMARLLCCKLFELPACKKQLVQITMSQYFSVFQISKSK